ncbi:hypothetical protein E5676_scaffold981G00120 [Cucumis melo var. makuwa]|uniref:Transposase n=1 Tax=Cucumis melo var. makuwa TaxID=1194695 RepID=A0A5D3CKY3_CUCMM|nr:hypothetical protein E5676_scaffold981G00120 [Cucumis melo var. makuwa]
MNDAYKLNIIDHLVMCELHEGKVVSNTIRWLEHGPNHGVMTYEGYMINGSSYQTKSCDDHRIVQNSGIMLVATTMQVSSAKTKNSVIGDMSFYGIIEDIWEKDFPYKCANDNLGDMLPHYPLVSKWNTTSDNDESGDTYTRPDCEGTWVYHLTFIGQMPKEIKDKIFELIKVDFVVDPQSKKTVIQNVGVCFSQFKYRLTTTYVLPFLDNVEELRFPPNKYSFIEQQHWTEFVASWLKEDFKDELVATQKTTNAFHEEDILKWALGGKDRPGIVRGVGKMKELEDELFKMKENDDYPGELKKEPGIGSTGKSSMKWAKNLNYFEDVSNDLESQKDVEYVVELNEEIKVNIVKDDEQVEGVKLEKMKIMSLNGGTIFDSDVEGDHVKVAVNVVVDRDCAILIPSKQMDSGEFSKDMTIFAPTPIQTAPVALRFLLRMVKHMGSAI